MFSKKDMKDAYVVVARNRWAVVWEGIDEIDFNDDLTCKYKKEHDIMRVIDIDKMVVLFERKEHSDELKAFCKSISEYWKQIAKDKDNTVYLFRGKPSRAYSHWNALDDGLCVTPDRAFKKGMFDSISWDDEEPTLIADILGDTKEIKE